MAAENNWEDGGSREHQDPPTTDAVWYVVAADEDTQLGPMSVAEVEERCHAGELDDTTMVWSVGMSDWLPLADVPDLAHLAPEPSRESKSIARPTDDESWTPISAEALVSLAAAVSPTPAVQHEPVSESPVRDLPEVKPAGFGDPAIGWSVPSPPQAPPPARSRAPLAYAAGLGGAAFIGAFVALFFAYEVAPPASGVSGKSDGMRPHSDDSARGSGGHALDSDPVVKQTAGPVEAEPEAKPIEPSPPVKDLCASVGCSGHGRCVARKEKARCSCDTGYRNAGPIRCVLKQKEPEEPTLDKAAIKQVVAERKPELRPCLARARKPSGVTAGKYPLVVSWMIRANGSVGQVRWGRPDWARSTSLPECFAAVIRTWSFPAPGRDFAVNNFPLGNVTLK